MRRSPYAGAHPSVIPTPSHPVPLPPGHPSPSRRGGSRSLFHKSSPMIYTKYAKTISDDLPGENMEYGPKVRHSSESRNPEGPILGEVRLLKQAPRTARLPTLKPAPTSGVKRGQCTPDVSAPDGDYPRGVEASKSRPSQLHSRRPRRPHPLRSPPPMATSPTAFTGLNGDQPNRVEEAYRDKTNSVNSPRRNTTDGGRATPQ